MFALVDVIMHEVDKNSIYTDYHRKTTRALCGPFSYALVSTCKTGMLHERRKKGLGNRWGKCPFASLISPCCHHTSIRALCSHFFANLNICNNFNLL